MRVIAGEAKGRTIKWPKDPHIRPTIDLVRGAMFSAMEALDVDWSYVLDLYAGTGALGIEALSRGAQHVDFVERNPKCCTVIKENLQRIGLGERGSVYRLEARKAVETLKGPYSIIFLDPPYADTQGQAVLDEIARSAIVEPYSTIIMEHSQKAEPKLNYGDFQIIRSLHHGDTVVSIYQCQGGNN